MRDDNAPGLSRTGRRTEAEPTVHTEAEPAKPTVDTEAEPTARSRNEAGTDGRAETPEERFDRLVHELDVANDCRPPRPGDPDY